MQAARRIASIGSLLLLAACSDPPADGPDFIPVDAPQTDPPAAQDRPTGAPQAAPATSEGSSIDRPVERDRVAPVVPSRCDRTKPFGAPRPVAGVSGATDTSNARLSADELTAFFMRTLAGTAGGNEIVVATRTERTLPFSGAAVVAQLSSPQQEGSPTVTADGLTMYLHSNRSGTYDVWRARRSKATDPWGEPLRVTEISSDKTEYDPFVRPDGRMIVFASNRVGHHQIYRASVADDGTVGLPSPISEINTSADETNPVLAEDGLAIYFSRATKTRDVFVARRASTSERFGPAERVAELATDQDEWPSWVSADECVLYLTIEGPTKKAIYSAARLP